MPIKQRLIIKWLWCSLTTVFSLGVPSKCRGMEVQEQYMYLKKFVLTVSTIFKSIVLGSSPGYSYTMILFLLRMITTNCLDNKPSKTKIFPPVKVSEILSNAVTTTISLTAQRAKVTTVYTSSLITSLNISFNNQFWKMSQFAAKLLVCLHLYVSWLRERKKKTARLWIALKKACRYLDQTRLNRGFNTWLEGLLVRCWNSVLPAGPCRAASGYCCLNRLMANSMCVLQMRCICFVMSPHLPNTPHTLSSSVWMVINGWACGASKLSLGSH